MISLNNISVQFGGESLFDHVSFIVNDNDRIGLTGKNGTGKSTLLKIIKGLHKADEGEVVIPSAQTIGYLPQEMVTDSRKTVWDEAMEAFSEILELKKRIAELDHQIATREDYESEEYHDLIRGHADAYERFHMLEGQSVHVNVEKVLAGLGFDPEELQRSVTTFSSGWKMRVELAKILLQRPDLILLDEPTNHLDIESIQWLEDFLINYRGAVILVSHDRAFLDNVTGRTIEITLGRIYDYKANYSGYLEMREERLESQLATYNNQQQQIRQIEKFIERFRYKNTKSKQVQSRIKMLEKMDEVEIDQMDDSGIHFRFPPAPHSGKIVLEAKGLSKSYPQKKVLNDLQFTVVKEDKIAFVGRNGEGKTTLSKIIAGQTNFDGELKFGHNVATGYYAQEQSDFLNPEKTVFTTIDDIATGDIRPKIRTILGGFLFSGETIDKKVKVLSGGEKSRLSLAKLLLTPSNLLILDEPTNHLDMHSKDILKNALLQYNGTLIIVSHDRDFLQGLTKKVFEFKNGGISEYPGDIYDFLETRRLKNLSQLEQNRQKEEKNTIGDSSSANKHNRERQKQFDREYRKVKTQVEKCESGIENLERELKNKEMILGDPVTFREQFEKEDVFEVYGKLKISLEKEVEKWAELQSELEEFDKQRGIL
ncbi:MAG: ABC-F family ATP-binding cassette domain-containing protein [Bacteroidota bacterium]